MRKIILLFFFILLFFAGCRLDPPIYPHNLLNATISENSFQLPAKDNTWVYQVDFGSHILENRITSIGIKETIAAKTYDVYKVTTNGNPASNVFFTHENGLYSMRQKPEVYANYIEFYYLKEDALIGETWTYPVNETGILNGNPARTVSRLVSQDLTVMVLGTEYKNVTRTQITIENKQDNDYVEFATYNFFVVKNIGIIQINTNVSGFESYTSLKNYIVK